MADQDDFDFESEDHLTQTSAVVDTAIEFSSWLEDEPKKDGEPFVATHVVVLAEDRNGALRWSSNCPHSLATGMLYKASAGSTRAQANDDD